MDKNLMYNVSEIRLQKTKLITLTGLLFAITLVLSVIENMLPPFLATLPGLKIGLSNIVVMYALFFLGRGRAFAIAVLKALFVFSVKGMVAGLLSLFGGILSLSVMIFLMILFNNKISYLLISIFGAIFHNLGQLIAVSMIYTNMSLWAYIPVLLAFGTGAGIATSTLLRFILPAFKKLGLK